MPRGCPSCQVPPCAGSAQLTPKPLRPGAGRYTVCVTTRRYTGTSNTPAQLVCTHTGIYRCLLRSSCFHSDWQPSSEGFYPRFQEPPNAPAPQAKPPGHRGSPHAFALPTGPWCGPHSVPARADALLQIRREGCCGDADLVGFFYGVCRNDLGKGNWGEGGDHRGHLKR